MTPTFTQIMNAGTAYGSSCAGGRGVLGSPAEGIDAVVVRPGQLATPMDVLHRLARALQPAACSTAILRPAGSGGC